MKISKLVPGSIHASKAKDEKVTLFLNKNTGNISYKDEEGNIIEVGSNISEITTIQSEIETLQIEVGAMPSPLLFEEVEVTSAQILAMNTSPIELLPALPSNQYYDYEVRIRNNFNTTPYQAQGSGFRVEYKAQVMGIPSGLLEVTATSSFLKASGDTRYSTRENVVLTMNADPISGDGTFTVQIKYRIITIL